VNTIDKKILELIDYMIYNKHVRAVKHFCSEVEMLEQTISKIKNGKAHFTTLHIESICRKFDVNANWIFNDSENIFNSEILDDIEDFESNQPLIKK
jgi:DNA-binding Xre family transcriptional regulator